MRLLSCFHRSSKQKKRLKKDPAEPPPAVAPVSVVSVAPVSGLPSLAELPKGFSPSGKDDVASTTGSPSNRVDRSPSSRTSLRFVPQEKDSPLRLASELRLSGMVVLRSQAPSSWLQQVREQAWDLLDHAEASCLYNAEGYYDITLSGILADTALGSEMRELWEPILLALGESQNALIMDDIPRDNFRMYSSGILSTDEGSVKLPWPKRPPPATAMEAALYCAILAGSTVMSPLSMMTCVHVFIPLVDWVACIGLSRLNLPAGSILVVDDKKAPKGMGKKRNSGKPFLYFTYCRRCPRDVEAYGQEALEKEARQILVPEKITNVMTRISTVTYGRDSSSANKDEDANMKKRLNFRPTIKKLCFGTDDAATRTWVSPSPCSPSTQQLRPGTGEINALLENGTDVEDDFLFATGGNMQRAPRVLSSSRVVPPRGNLSSAKSATQASMSQERSLMRNSPFGSQHFSM